MTTKKAPNGNLKSKFSSINLNALHKPLPVVGTAKPPPARGLVALTLPGKEKKTTAKFEPPRPVQLRSLKAENQGLDPTVNLVPAGGLGWGKRAEPKEETKPEGKDAAPEMAPVPKPVPKLLEEVTFLGPRNNGRTRAKASVPKPPMGVKDFPSLGGDQGRVKDESGEELARSIRRGESWADQAFADDSDDGSAAFGGARSSAYGSLRPSLPTRSSSSSALESRLEQDSRFGTENSRRGSGQGDFGPARGSSVAGSGASAAMRPPEAATEAATVGAAETASGSRDREREARTRERERDREKEWERDRGGRDRETKERDRDRETDRDTERKARDRDRSSVDEAQEEERRNMHSYMKDQARRRAEQRKQEEEELLAQQKARAAEKLRQLDERLGEKKKKQEAPSAEEDYREGADKELVENARRPAEKLSETDMQQKPAESSSSSRPDGDRVARPDRLSEENVSTARVHEDEEGRPARKERSARSTEQTGRREVEVAAGGDLDVAERTPAAKPRSSQQARPRSPDEKRGPDRTPHASPSKAATDGVAVEGRGRLESPQHRQDRSGRSLPSEDRLDQHRDRERMPRSERSWTEERPRSDLVNPADAARDDRLERSERAERHAPGHDRAGRDRPDRTGRSAAPAAAAAAIAPATTTASPPAATHLTTSATLSSSDGRLSRLDRPGRSDRPQSKREGKFEGRPPGKLGKQEDTSVTPEKPKEKPSAWGAVERPTPAPVLTSYIDAEGTFPKAPVPKRDSRNDYSGYYDRRDGGKGKHDGKHDYERYDSRDGGKGKHDGKHEYERHDGREGGKGKHDGKHEYERPDGRDGGKGKYDGKHDGKHEYERHEPKGKGKRNRRAESRRAERRLASNAAEVAPEPAVVDKSPEAQRPKPKATRGDFDSDWRARDDQYWKGRGRETEAEVESETPKGKGAGKRSTGEVRQPSLGASVVLDKDPNANEVDVDLREEVHAESPPRLCGKGELASTDDATASLEPAVPRTQQRPERQEASSSSGWGRVAGPTDVVTEIVTNEEWSAKGSERGKEKEMDGQERDIKEKGKGKGKKGRGKWDDEDFVERGEEFKGKKGKKKGKGKEKVREKVKEKVKEKMMLKVAERVREAGRGGW